MSCPTINTLDPMNFSVIWVSITSLLVGHLIQVKSRHSVPLPLERRTPILVENRVVRAVKGMIAFRGQRSSSEASEWSATTIMRNTTAAETS